VLSLIILISVTSTISQSSAVADPISVATLNLGTAANYSVLAGSAFTEGATNIFSPVGSTAFGQLTAPSQAWSDAYAAYNDAVGRTFTTQTGAPDIALGTVFRAGVHNFPSYLSATSNFTLDGEDNPNSVFIFQITGYLTTAANLVISLTNGAQSSNIFFQVGGYLTTGAGSNLPGTFLVNHGVTTGAGTTLNGRVIAIHGAVTTGAGNSITVPSSQASVTDPSTTSNTKYTIVFTDTTLNEVVIGTAYSDFIRAEARIGEEATSAVITYAVDSTTPLPSGLSLNRETGYLTGTLHGEATAGTFTFIFTASTTTTGFPTQNLSFKVKVLNPASHVVSLSQGVTRAAILETAVLPAITLEFLGTTPINVTITLVSSNPATSSSTPFKISSSSKIVDITPSTEFTGSATVCLSGAETDYLFHYSGGAWVELPSRTYVAGNPGQVCGVTTSFSPFTAAQKNPISAPVVVYVPPTPIPYLKTLTNPQIHLSGDKLTCSAGTYNSGYILNGVILESATALYTPTTYGYNLLFNQIAQSTLAMTAATNSAMWSISSAPAGAFVSCSVTVSANSLKNTDSTTANLASVSAALTTQSQSAATAENAYNAVISANSNTYQKALVDNRVTWRGDVDKVRAAYFAELARINELPASKENRAQKSAALKTYIVTQKKLSIDFKASGPAAMAVRDLVNKVALETKNAAIVKANSIYGAFIESIGYGVLLG
jgi:type VI secretion system secreted protein VgrG